MRRSASPAIRLVRVLLGAHPRSEEANVLGEVGDAGEGPWVERHPGVDADRRGEVLGLREEEGNAVVQEEETTIIREGT